MVGICGQGAILRIVVVAVAVSGDTLQARLDALEARVDSLEADLATTNDKLDAILVNQTRSIGFTVIKPVAATSPTHRMNFTVILTNAGNGWNTIAATFKPPVAGTYYFHFSLLKRGAYDDLARCSIFKNSASLVTAYVNPGNIPKNGNYYLGNGVYKNLSIDDTVTLENCKTPIASAFHENSSFSGFLVTPRY